MNRSYDASSLPLVKSTKVGGQRIRNTEILTFDGDKISKAEVYFGWNLDD